MICKRGAVHVANLSDELTELLLIPPNLKSDIMTFHSTLHTKLDILLDFSLQNTVLKQKQKNIEE
jgi:hypothetical protein